jgi:hypothetical protein
VIGGLLADHPSKEDARIAARAWLMTRDLFLLAGRLEATAERLADVVASPAAVEAERVAGALEDGAEQLAALAGGGAR